MAIFIHSAPLDALDGFEVELFCEMGRQKGKQGMTGRRGEDKKGWASSLHTNRAPVRGNLPFFDVHVILYNYLTCYLSIALILYDNK